MIPHPQITVSSTLILDCGGTEMTYTKTGVKR